MKKLVLVLLMMMSAFQLSFADSPLTSTDFYKAYLDVPIVAAAAKNPGKLSNEAKAYLFDDNNPLDVKLALINAVGWRMEGLSTYTDYLRYCFNHFPKAKFGIEEKSFSPKKIFSTMSPVSRWQCWCICMPCPTISTRRACLV